MIEDMLTYLEKSGDQFLIGLWQHIQLSLIAFVVATVIGVVLGYFCARNERIKQFTLPLFQGLRIIPSLAVLLLLLPVLGTGEKPALCALILLAIPAILMNTVTGFQSIDPLIKESGIALGMDEKQLLYKVEVPSALPLILAGMKTAMLEIIASATIAAKIGAGGLGGLIFTGIGLNRSDLLLIGGGSVALLAIIMRMILNGSERWLLRYKYIHK